MVFTPSLLADTLGEREFQIALTKIPSIETICKFLQKENLLCNPPITNFVDLRPFYTEESLRCEQLTIELTGNCNLRCKYCVYNDFYEGNRTFNTSNIDFETARKAIDYVYAHSSEERLAITFYGGEPLLNFRVMKQCIDYCLETIKHKQLYFSFTTNLTLMTREIADYVAQIPNMGILISLDGPEETHNRARVKRNGEGSFKDAYRGLMLLIEAVNKYKNTTLSFNAVLMPPYTTEHFNEINDFFEGLEGLPINTEVRATYPSPGSIPDSFIADLRASGISNLEDTTWLSWAKAKTNNTIVLGESKNIHSDVLKTGLTHIHNRILHERPMGIVHYNGCCIPGKRRLYVCTDGSYKVCERIGNAPIIGNVDSGIDFESIEQFYLAEYEKGSVSDCAQCWAVNLCDICYAQCYDKNGLNIGEKRKLCPQAKKRYLQWLQDYHELLENRPEVIAEISKIQVT